MARFGSPKGAPTQALSDGHDDDVKKVVVTARCTPAIRAKANQTAQALGISVSALLCELIERLEVDETGHPGWVSRYAAPVDDGDQQALELSA